MEVFPNLLDEAQTPEKGVLSRTLHNDEALKIVLFSFAEGEELSEHTSSLSAVVQILEGQARLSLGGKMMDAGPGALVHMEPGLPHAIRAETALKMLLILVKAPPGSTV